MKLRLLALSALLAAGETVAAGDRSQWTPLEPADAIAEVNSAPGGIRARFAMTVRAVGNDRAAWYLNSTEDYTAADNVTFHLPPSAKRAVERMLGGPIESVVGRRVIVDGRMTNVPIYEKSYGRSTAFARMQHTVRLRQASGIVAVE